MNVVATYGRSLYALVCGLFTARWVLMSLGEVDYGLVGVVGGLTGFIGFLNGVMATAVSRFYAYSVGAASVAADKNAGVEECRRWFNVAVALHTAIPLTVMLLGYPIGEWAVRNFLTIPPDKIETCVWVFRFSCLGCLVSMMSVPYSAMYSAKQEIAELTIYGFATTTANVIFLCYMVSHPGAWLLRYSAWICMLGVLPSTIIAIRATIKYQECRYCVSYMWNRSRFKNLFAYAASCMLSSLAYLFSWQGMTVMVNKTLGLAVNATVAVATNAQGHVLSLTGSIRGAMSPAITNAFGAGQKQRFAYLVERASVCSTIALLVFAIPLCLEVDEVVRIWLKNPPQGTGTLLTLFLAANAVDLVTIGQCMGITAGKKIAAFQISQSLCVFSALPIALAFIVCGHGVPSIGYGYIAMYALSGITKLWFARWLGVFTIRRRHTTTLLPLSAVALFTLMVGSVPKLICSQSFQRVFLTILLSEAAFLPLCWFLILKSDERLIIKRKFGLFLRNKNIEVTQNG